ncbi:hypothetical protein CP97_14637 [Aurantiacibacter atlanticus]|uniref:Uncharacterized protein n=1 Tax=Aurantiacibacter atlanticus TaxID=1648404 RepID=A0A168LZX8_9SPHN|nr:hypothetical protein CP97_14637 [Aurantiacibacter atlanticus]
MGREHAVISAVSRPHGAPLSYTPLAQAIFYTVNFTNHSGTYDGV